MQQGWWRSCLLRTLLRFGAPKVASSYPLRWAQAVATYKCHTHTHIGMYSAAFGVVLKYPATHQTLERPQKRGAARLFGREDEGPESNRVEFSKSDQQQGLGNPTSHPPQRVTAKLMMTVSLGQMIR